MESSDIIGCFALLTESLAGLFQAFYMRLTEKGLVIDMYEDISSSVLRVYNVLERLGYKPIVVGTFALIIQGWLPRDYLYATKDIDIYVDEPMIVFDGRLEGSFNALGLVVGRSEAGGMYVDALKPIKIIYPVHGIYIPSPLLREIVMVEDMRVLEGHSVLVAKAFGGNIEYLARALIVRPDLVKLVQLVESMNREVDPVIYNVVKRRVERFIEELSRSSRG